jgi:rod shape-determining protein MreC
VLAFLKRHRDIVLVVVLLVAPLGRYFISGHRGRDLNPVDRLALSLASPLQSALSSFFGQMQNGFESYAALRGAHEANQVCQTSLSQATAELNSLREAKAENERLKSIVAYVEPTIEQEIIARVIGFNPTSLIQSVRIDRGENHGVRVGMPVVTPEGVVGQVIRVVGSSSDVMLISDAQSHAGAMLQRTRVRATVSGSGAGWNPAVDLIKREEDLQMSDVLITAGTDGVFPAGLNLGKIIEVTRPNVGMFYLAKLKPGVDFHRLEEVIVLPMTLTQGPP